MSREAPKILVAGIGNIFLGDDGFGVEVVQRMARRVAQGDIEVPESVRVADFGIRGLDLAYALTDVEVAILVDAMPRGEAPGTLSVMEIAMPGSGGEPAAIEGHSMDPARVLQVAAALGAQMQRVLIVGCEPQCIGDEPEWQMGLSPAVEGAVDEAVNMVLRIMGEIGAPAARASPVG